MNIRFAHTNLVAKDWKSLAQFYQDVFGCEPVPPERDLKGEWLDKALGIPNVHIQGIHLRLPGYGPEGPTLEVFQYGAMPEHPMIATNTPGFSHIAFDVDVVASVAQKMFQHGGSPIGDFTVPEVAGVGVLTFQYIADPEGNIVEIQSWDKEK